MSLVLPAKGQLLPPIDGLTMAAGAHRYCFRGDWLPFSVTGIVSDLRPAARKQIERTKDGPDGWELRGTSIHAILAALTRHRQRGADWCGDRRAVGAVGRAVARSLAVA